MNFKSLLVFIVGMLSSCSMFKGSSDQESSFGDVSSLELPEEFDPRADHCMANVNGSVYVYGGAGYSQSTKKIGTLDSGFKFNLETETWSEMEKGNFSPGARKNHYCLELDKTLFIWGGESFSGGSFRSGAFYDSFGENWTTISSESQPRNAVNMSLIRFSDTGVFAWGGANSSGEGSILNFTNNQWSQIAADPAIDGRLNHSTVDNEQLIYVWGGRSSGELTKTGGIYSIETQSWTAMSLIGAPEAREFHTAISTDEAMIVWGGQGENGLLADGGIYEFSTDTWSDLPNTSLSARIDHEVVWTGEYMIVWGGTSENTVENNGAAYRPESNSWTIIGSMGLLPRIGHSMLAVENKVFLLGGWDGPKYKFDDSDHKYRKDGVVISL